MSDIVSTRQLPVKGSSIMIKQYCIRLDMDYLTQHLHRKWARLQKMTEQFPLMLQLQTQATQQEKML